MQECSPACSRCRSSSRRRNCTAYHVSASTVLAGMPLLRFGLTMRCDPHCALTCCASCVPAGAGVQQPDVSCGRPGVLHIPANEPLRCECLEPSSAACCVMRQALLQHVLQHCSLAHLICNHSQDRSCCKTFWRPVRWRKTRCTPPSTWCSCCRRVRCSRRPGSRCRARPPTTSPSSCASSRCSCRCVLELGSTQLCASAVSITPRHVVLLLPDIICLAGMLSSVKRH